MLCSFPSRGFTIHSHRSLINLFGRLKKKSLQLWENGWNTGGGRQILGVHCPKNLIVSANPGYETLKEWIRCLLKNAIERLYVATSQSINDRTEQMMRLHTSQLAMIGIPIVRLTSLTCISSRGVLKKPMCVFWSSTSLKFALLKQVVLKINNI